MKVKSFHLPLGAALLAVSAGADAQTAGGPTLLPPVVVTATRTETPLPSVGSAVTIITRQEIDRTHAHDLVTLLERVPGVTVTRTGGFGSSTSVRLRGADVRHTLVLIDGVRVNDPSSTGGEFDWSSVQTGAIERVEVLRGPQSALYGNEAIGGVVNIITRRGSGAFSGYADVYAGTYSTFGGKTGVQGSSGSVDYALTAEGVSSDGFSRKRNNSEADGTRTGSFQTRLGWQMTEGVRVQATGSYHRQNSDYDPFSGTDATYDEHRWNGRADAIFEGFDRRLKQTVSVFATDLSRRYEEGLPFRSDNTYSGGTQGVEYQADLKLRSADVATLGLSARRESYSVRGTYGASEGDTATRAVFGQYQWQVFSPLTLSLAGRWEDNDDFGGKGSYRLAGVYALDATDTSFRASWGTGAKAPSLYQLFAPLYGNSRLQAESSRGFDFGVEQRFGDVATVAVTYFDNHYTNLIDFDFATSRYLNLARAKTNGIETAITLQPLPELQFGLSYTWLTSKDLVSRAELPRRPEHSFSVTADWQPVGSVSLGASYKYGSSQRDTAFGAARSGQGGVMDLRASWTVQPGWTLYSRLDNLFNADIEEAGGYRNAGRTLLGGLRVDF